MSAYETRTRTLALTQGAFWIAAGLWPVLHLRSFAKVTGPKPEGWLAKAVGSMMAVIGGTLLCAGARRRVTPEVRNLAVSSALLLGGMDVFYVAKRRIKPTYLLDAAPQAAFVVAWLWSEQARRPRAARSLAHPPDLGVPDLVDEASMESFPASDPPAITLRR